MKKIEVIKEFKDKTSAENVADQKLLKVGDIIECEDSIADSRIALGLAKPVLFSKDLKDKPKSKKI